MSSVACARILHGSRLSKWELPNILGYHVPYNGVSIQRLEDWRLTLVPSLLSTVIAIIGVMVEMCLLVRILIVVFIVVGFSGSAAIAWGQQYARDRQRMEDDSRHGSLVDTVRSVAGGELPPLQASATIQADTPTIRVRESNRHWVRRWFRLRSGRDR